MISSTQPEQDSDSNFAGQSFDDDVLTSAQRQAGILRQLGYRTEAAHIERFVDRQTPVEEAPAA